MSDNSPLTNVERQMDSLDCDVADVPDELMEALNEAYRDMITRHQMHKNGDNDTMGPVKMSQDKQEGLTYATLTGVRHFERILNAIEREDDS